MSAPFSETRDKIATVLMSAHGLSICDAADVAGSLALVAHANRFADDSFDIERVDVAIEALRTVRAYYAAVLDHPAPHEYVGRALDSCCSQYEKCSVCGSDREDDVHQGGVPALAGVH